MIVIAMTKAEQESVRKALSHSLLSIILLSLFGIYSFSFISPFLFSSLVHNHFSSLFQSLSFYLGYQTSMATLSFSTKDDKKQEGLVDKNPIAQDQTVLQKHVTFFDRNHDGLIYPWETFQGFRAIGCGFLLSTVAAVFINGGLSRKTRQGKFSILFPIEVKNIQGGKHGSDSGVFDTEGRFVSSKFEEIFSKHAKKHPNALTSDELMGMLKANRVPKDYTGWLASYVEWKILYVLAKDNDGLLQKETLHAVYDGSLFQQMENEHSGKKNK